MKRLYEYIKSQIIFTLALSSVCQFETNTYNHIRRNISAHYSLILEHRLRMYTYISYWLRTHSMEIALSHQLKTSNVKDTQRFSLLLFVFILSKIPYKRTYSLDTIFSTNQSR